MKAAANKPVGRSPGFLSAIVWAFSLGTAALAVPIIDNNAGTWSDTYNDNLGVQSIQGAIVDSIPGVVKLAAGQTSGSYETVRIKPPSFNAWGTLKLSGAWSAPTNVQVSVIDPVSQDTIIAPAPYTGEISLAGIDPVEHPELAVVVALAEGTVSPMVSDLGVTWTPRSCLLLDKSAPASVLAGQRIAYRIRYSVNYVEAQDLVIWDKLPLAADGTMTYPADHGQKDDVAFVEASRGGVYTATPVTVRGVAIPGGSVYWDLGTKPEGATETLWFTVRTKNGTLDGSRTVNRATAEAANAATVQSAAIETRIESEPAPSITKRGGAGIYTLESGDYTFPALFNRFTIEARNDYAGEGRETMYGTVVYDDLSNLMDKIAPDLGGAGIPVVDIYPTNGTYTAAYTPPSGGAPFPAVVWTNRPTLGPGEKFTGAFTVQMLDAASLDAAGSYTNTAWVDSGYTDPLSSSLAVSWPADETPYGVFAKGDNLDSRFDITVKNDDPALFVRPGASFPYGLSVRNVGMVALNDLILLDRIPDGTTFKSAWFTDSWLQTNAVVFYSTADTGDMGTPPAFSTNNVPHDLDPAGADLWSTDLPADPANVRWVAFYIPAVNSHHAGPGSAGWIDGAPRTAVGYFDVTVSPAFLDPKPCVDKLITNRGLFNAYGYTPMAGGAKVASHMGDTNDEITRVAIDKPKLVISTPGQVTPAVLEEPGQLAYTVEVQNRGTALAEDVLLEIRWPIVNINGVPQYLAFDSVSPVSIREFDPGNGRLVLEMGNLAPGARASATLKASVTGGLVFGQQLTFASTATATALCPPAPVSDTASAVARFAPRLKAYKNDVLDLIPSGGTVDYTLALYNTGHAPSRGTYVVDRVPDETVLVHATGPNGERVWFSATDNLPPSFLSPTEPINAATIAANFTLGTQDDDVWTSPFGEQTRWVAWEMDCMVGESKFYPVGCTHVVGLRLRNDLDGPGPGTEGSPEGAQIFNTTGAFSDELLQAIGNEVVTTIKIAPGILVEKTGPDVVTKGDTFTWTVDYYNNSGIADDVATITDTLPPGVEFLSATHTWNATAVTNGAPANNSGLAVPSATNRLDDGSTRLVFNVASTNGGYRGAHAKLLTKEGGTITITVRAKDDLPSHAELPNRVTGMAEANDETVTSHDDHLVLVRNAEIRVRKLAAPALPVAGDTVTYNLVVGNSGQVAARDVVIADHLPAGVTFVTNSTRVLTSAYSIGQPSVSGGVLTWSVAHTNALTKDGLPPGELPARSGDVVIQYKGIVDSTVPAGTHLPNTVTVGTITPEDGTESNEDEAAVDTPYPDPVVVKDGPAVVHSGDRFDWTITYYNATRQAGENVYIVDTLPDADGDGSVDVTFVEQRATGPGAVTAYYHSGSSTNTPAFDPSAPLAGGWTNAPVVPVQHIAWVIGTLPGSAGPYTIAVTAIAAPPSGAPLPAGTALRNAVEIFVSGTDQNPDNNTDEHTPRTPSNDVALTKTGSTEGAVPGLVPGDEIVYEIVVENTGTETAYGIEVADILPSGLQLAGDGAEDVLALVNADGEPALPVDADGDEIGEDVPLTRVATTNGVAWFFGSPEEGSALYFRKVGLLPGQRQTLALAARVALDVPNGTPLVNTATVTLHNRNDAEPGETYLGNNTDGSETVVYRPDVAVRKSVADAATGDADWTEAGSLLTYTIEYNNLGDAVARDTVITEIVPEGTTLVSVNNPDGSTVAYHSMPGSGARSFDVRLGDLDPNPSMVAVPFTYGAKGAAKLTQGPDGFPALRTYDRLAEDIVSIGDVNGDGIPDLLAGVSANAAGGANYSGGAWVILLDEDGTAKASVELANGANGIPLGTFQASDYGGRYVSGLGDVDGDGVPDVALSQHRDASNQIVGGAVVVLLNADGTAKSVVELQNGANGVPADLFTTDDPAYYGLAGGTDMDGDDVPDLFMGDASRFGFYLMLLNTNGTVKSAIPYLPGTNGIPDTAAFTDGLTGGARPLVIGDVDGNGVPDLFVATYSADALSGGGVVILFNPDLTVKSAVRLTRGYNGMPPDCFANSNRVGFATSPLGDFDGNGVPDVLFGSPYFATHGGAVILLLNADGTAKDVIALTDGVSGIPAGTFTSSAGMRPLGALGDVDGDGVTDIMLGAQRWTNSGPSQLTGVLYMAFMNPDGTVKDITRMRDGAGGMPPGPVSTTNAWDQTGTAIGDIDGDGITDFAVGLPRDNDRAGAVWVVRPGIVPLPYDPAAVTPEGRSEVEFTLEASDDMMAWHKLVSEADVPEGAALACTIGRLDNGTPVYDLGPAFTDIPYPLPPGGLDISAIPADYKSLVVKLAYSGSDPPVVGKLHLYYVTGTWPSFTFTVRVDDPVAAAVLPDIDNTVAISTATPESDYDNNSDEADIMVKTLDLEVAKTADKSAVLTNELVTFTLAWRNNGPWAAVNAVLEDVLPAGLTFVSSQPTTSAVSGNVYSWNLGDVAPGAGGTVTVVARVDNGTEGRTLLNTARIANDRQESDTTNNEDFVPVIVKQLVNVWIEKSGPATARLGGEAVYTLAYGNNGSAPSEARRFLRGGSPRRVRTSHPLVPSVGTMEEESNPNEVV
jgi:uncharacterized repeat protein (TIGR01451 family)/fimbrial isopeptide formation D2 family protein